MEPSESAKFISKTVNKHIETLDFDKMTEVINGAYNTIVQMA